ncbi:MAG: tyrosine-protein phosphatase [Ardenticatenaceae bacterium]|nr:tyrosine-protein phosphatase [Anaerolineales bacterium]MCB9009252.1 tyrosine-protein phosphatase [Ardenticatenaceae bacterium]
MKIEPLPSQRVKLQGESNFRDLGGYQTADGRSVKWGLLYRSGSLNRLTDDDLAQLEKRRIQTVIDFRSAAEVESLGQDRYLNGAQSVALPINPGQLTSTLTDALQNGNLSSITPDVMVQMYRGFVRECKEQYSRLVQLATNPAKRPLVAHCTHGKDRTGVGTAVILSILGVPWETITNDYMLSNHYLKDEQEAQKAEMRRLMTKPGGTPLNDADMTYIAPLFTVAPAYLDGARLEMVDDYGSVENYIREGLGISDEMRDRLRGELLD